MKLHLKKLRTIFKTMGEYLFPIEKVTSYFKSINSKKDLQNFIGDFTLNYLTIPVKYGEKVSKVYISFCSAIVLIVCYLILVSYELSYMKYFYYFNYFFFVFFNYLVWNSNSKVNYQYLHNSLKLLIVLGLFSIILHGI